MVRVKYFNGLIIIITVLCGQFEYNHPEVEWQTLETEHFQIHFYEGTVGSAREGAYVAEQVYPYITRLYQYEPPTKTDIIFIDFDDISNGAAYYYDNKIVIWTSPLEFELRGSHRWLQNVITHEFTHIVSLQKAMKAGLKFPAVYFQWVEYGDENRPDVIYGFPQKLMSYAVPGTALPPWLTEGTAQFMYVGADWDHWDTHRDMILRDRALNDNLLSFTEMNTFGKKGIGNESTYNSGFALCRYIAEKYGPEALQNIISELAKPFQYSVSDAIAHVIGIDGWQLFNDFSEMLIDHYRTIAESVINNEYFGQLLLEKGTANLYPKWSPDGGRIAYLSNQDNDFFSQTDLFIYDVETATVKKIVSGVFSAPFWHSTQNIIYYGKKSIIPDKYGSRFYDIYMYNFDTAEETRLTNHQRAYNPVYVDGDSSIFFLSTKDGGQNIFRLNLKNNSIQKMTEFTDRSIISGLAYDVDSRRLLFNRTQHHYRDTYFLSLADSSMDKIFANPLWDERDGVSKSQRLIYADDRSGIYNLYMIDEQTGQQGYITNVTGGAFMPDISHEGKIVYALYMNGGYKIALLDSIQLINSEIVGYTPTYFKRNEGLTTALNQEYNEQAEPYNDDFTTMFIAPRILIDYGTIKPGFYFFSNEVLNRLNVLGGAAVNSELDLDLFFIFEFKRFYPTLFAEVFYLTRNTQEINYYTTYKLDNYLKFRLTELNAGMRFPLFGTTQLDLMSSWQVYRAFVKQTIAHENIYAGVAYDYYRGWVNSAKWQLNSVKRFVDSDINPSKGYMLTSTAQYEKNEFILYDESSAHDTWRINLAGKYHVRIPFTNRWTFSLASEVGWLSNNRVNPFFNYYAGGLLGIKGYPFYSIEGTRLLINDIILRIPIFSQRHFQLGWFILQNSVIGIIYQNGNAWNGNFDSADLKSSVGIQWRFNGFSFYNFPTAIELELHHGMNRFEKTIDDKHFAYGGENRFYFKLLFGFQE